MSARSTVSPPSPSRTRRSAAVERHRRMHSPRRRRARSRSATAAPIPPSAGGDREHDVEPRARRRRADRGTASCAYSSTSRGDAEHDDIGRHVGGSVDAQRHRPRPRCEQRATRVATVGRVDELDARARRVVRRAACPAPRPRPWSRHGDRAPDELLDASRARSPPTRRIAGRRRVQSTIVDSTPTRHGPPSSTRSTSSPRSARTSPRWSGSPARTGSPTAPRRRRRTRASSASATGWSGTRSPTVSSPPSTASATRRAARAQHERQRSRPALAGERRARRRDVDATQSSSWSTDAMCTITGWSARPALHRGRAGAPRRRFAASAPSPYTVSVGNATSPPRADTSTARAISRRRRGRVTSS